MILSIIGWLVKDHFYCDDDDDDDDDDYDDYAEDNEGAIFM